MRDWIEPRRDARENEVLLEPSKILGGVVKSVRVVDPKTVHLAFRDQIQDESVRVGENLLAFHTERGEIADVEEPAVINLIRCHAPVREAITLMFQQFVEPIET